MDWPTYEGLRFAEPGWLALLALAAWPLLRRRTRSRLAWPTLAGFAGSPRGLAPLGALPVVCRALAIACLAVALARPQTVAGRTHIAGQGVAIVVALDRSSSMQAADFPDGPGRSIPRLEAAKRTLARFVAGRPEDLIGLVAFANYPDLASPPTLDHEFVMATADALRAARAGEDGTNIGDAVAWGLEALSAAPPKRKVLVLLTDGENRPAVPEPLAPLEAARLAHELGVTLHAVALGAPGGLRLRESVTGLEHPGQDSGPDLGLLGAMAERGGGRMFVADDAAGLEAVFRDIDALERSPIRGTVRTRYREWYWVFVVAAFGLLAGDLALRAGRLGELP